jgi:hypothetical protein
MSRSADLNNPTVTESTNHGTKPLHSKPLTGFHLVIEERRETLIVAKLFEYIQLLGLGEFLDGQRFDLLHQPLFLLTVVEMHEL